jgi:hypothetical protein
MKPDEEIIGTACRIEVNEETGQTFIVFEITSEKYKQEIKKTWTQDIEFKIVNRSLVRENE